MKRGFIVDLLAPEPDPRGGEVLVVIGKSGPHDPIGALAAWDRYRREPGCYVNVRRGAK